MAAIETLWIDSMSSTPRNPQEHAQNLDPNTPTVASFAPQSLSYAASSLQQRPTILVHQKSPLLVATPPEITRALTYSHPFLLPLNKLAGLLTWTTGDPWASFLVLAGFWSVVLYGDVIVRWAGPIVLVISLMACIYSRRYSPMSSSGASGERSQDSKKKSRGSSSNSSEDDGTVHQKSLDEIVDTLNVFTKRCNILLEPILRLTDFMATQRASHNATMKPALTSLFVRVALITPLWFALTLPPLRILSTKRVVLTIGTLFLTWHSRPARISRGILWRSLTIRQLCSTLTGLTFEDSPQVLSDAKSDATSSLASRGESAVSLPASTSSPGIRFTFIVYENQRRWLGLGWTSSLFSYERDAWTDEYLNPAPPKDEFKLPEVEGGQARWQWVEDSEWRVAGEERRGSSTSSSIRAGTEQSEKAVDADGGAGWIYYDNKWRDGRRGQNGWGRYTRRRKWYRDAELVKVTPELKLGPTPSTPARKSYDASRGSLDNPPLSPSMDPPPRYADVDAGSGTSSNRKKWFRNSLNGSKSTGSESKTSETSSRQSFDLDEDKEDHPAIRGKGSEGEWGVGDEAQMGLG